jgi:uncharacterized protein
MQNKNLMNERAELVKYISSILMGEDPAHGWPHVQRVLRFEELIIKNEGLEVNDELLKVATYLHDVGRFLKGEEHHAVKSVKFAKRLLKSLGYEDEFIERVQKIILAHSYSLRYEAECIEAKVLSDADKLDALGAIGLARVFYYGCTSGRNFEDNVKHVVDKLLRLPDLMYFKYSKMLALKRVKILQEYVEAFKEEISMLRESS